MMGAPLNSAVLRGVHLEGRGLRVGRPAPVPPLSARVDSDAELQQRIDAAEQAGHAEGLRRGLAEAQAEFVHAREALARDQRVRADLQEREHGARLQQMDHLLQALQQAARQRLVALEHDTAALACAVAHKVIGDQAHSPQAILHLVQVGMAELKGGVLERVRIGATDLEALKQDAAGRQLLARFTNVQWQADDTLSDGGCQFDTPAGTLDARIERQLACLRQAWASVVAEGEI